MERSSIPEIGAIETGQAVEGNGTAGENTMRLAMADAPSGLAGDAGNLAAVAEGGDRRPSSGRWINRILIDGIKIPSDRRPLNQEKVQQLAESFAAVGQIHPIIVTDGMVLIAGWHRIEAAKLLGWTHLDALIVAVNEVRRQLIEIDENLVRYELTAVERADYLARRKQLYVALHPETKHGGAPGQKGGGKKPREAKEPKMGSFGESSGEEDAASSPARSFVDDTAQKTGRSPTTVKRDVYIGERLPDDVKDTIRETSVADIQTDLLDLARMPEVEQRKVAQVLASGQATRVKEAKRILSGSTEPGAPGAQALDPSRVDVRHASMQDLLGELRGLDALITDPPDPEEDSPIYAELASRAKAALAPAGILAVMCEARHVFHVRDAIAPYLPFRGLLIYIAPNGRPLKLGNRQIVTLCRAVLIFGGRLRWTEDTLKADDGGGVGRLVEALTQPDALVCDPFLGAGGTAIACARLGRRFVGGDRDAEKVEMAHERIGSAAGGVRLL